MNAKVKVAMLSVFSNTLLIILKLIVGLISGSVSIISEAIHSSMDLLAAIIAFFSVRVSNNPPDEQHPYGHGKIENLSGVIEAILIFVAAFWIIYESVKKLINPGEIEKLGIGMLVMIISALVNVFVSRRLYKVAKETNSVALEADALHLKADVYTSLGVAAGLILIWITGIYILDPIVAILVALYILKESYELFKKAFTPILDASWENRELNQLHDILKSMDVDYHDLKTRKSGNYNFIEFHMNMPANESIKNVHDFCDEIECNLKKHIHDLTVHIHVEPHE